MSDENNEFVLYTYFRSSCSARIRIALNLKQIPYKSVYVNLLTGAQHSPEYAHINPSGLVPSLQHVTGDNADNSVYITQSLAIMEYLEERFPQNMPLLPPATDPIGRATVRSLANIIACDIQPVTNLRILSSVDGLGGSREHWAKQLMKDGLVAYEKLASKTSGRFSYGDQITISDVFLVPAVWGALRFGIEMKAFPVISKIFEDMSRQKAVEQSHWKTQEDTPTALRD